MGVTPSTDAVREAIQKAGGADKLPILDGPTVEVFEPKAVARAIKSEVLRARGRGWTRISLHMELADALALARALERT